MLDFLHKRVLGKCHVALFNIFPLEPNILSWHNKQLKAFTDQCIGRHQLFYRSIFGAIAVYNRLPQQWVDLDSVMSFQKALTQIARNRCRNGDEHWPSSFDNYGQIWESRRIFESVAWRNHIMARMLLINWSVSVVSSQWRVTGTGLDIVWGTSLFIMARAWGVQRMSA